MTEPSKPPEILAIEPAEDGDGVTLTVKGFDPPSALIAELRRLAHEIEQGDTILLGAIVTHEFIKIDFRRRHGARTDA
jgi:hypothetical protein